MGCQRVGHDLASEQQQSYLGSRKVFFPFGSTQEWVIEVAQSCLTLCNPVDYILSGSSVHGILQAKILEWVAISFSTQRDALIWLPYFSNRVCGGCWGLQRLMPGGHDRSLLDLGLRASTILLAAQPCSYSIWPSSTFLHTMPLLSSYLQCTRGGCLPRLDRVPPFNQDAHQVFQNHPEGMRAVGQSDSSLSSSFPPSLPLFFSSFLPIYLLTVGSMPDTKTFLIIWV